MLRTQSTACLISEYLIDAATGSLVSIGTIADVDSPYSVVADPTGRYVYTGSQGSSISAYAVTGTGALSSIGTIAGAAPWSVAVNPSGTFAYAADAGSGNNAGTIVMKYPEQFTLDPTGKWFLTTISSADPRPRA